MKKETYIRRRAQLKRDMASGLLLFLGNDEVGMNYADNTYRFRQDSTFFYYFGLDYAGLAAVIDVDNDTEIVFGNELTIDDIVWTGTQPSLREKAEVVGISKTLPMGELKNYLGKARARGQVLHFLPPYRGDHRVWLWELLGVEPAAQPSQASVPFIKAIVSQRNHKDEEELRLIEESVDLSTEMHLAAYRTVRPGIHESEVAAVVEEVACRHGGALAFPTIATVQGQVLHNHGFIHELKDGDIFLLDAGAETRPLEPGFVFTVEPGIYFIPELMDKWEAEGQFRDFICYDKLKPWRDFTGLRNELNYVITENSARLLGTIKKPMAIEDVYAAKGQ